MKLRFYISVSGPMKWLSHLDLNQMLMRAMRRAGWPLQLSQGFNPHPQLTWGLPLPVGHSGAMEPIEVKLSLEPGIEMLLQFLADAAPVGITAHTIGAQWVPAKPSVAALVEAASYEIELPLPQCAALQARMLDWLGGLEVEVSRGVDKKIRFETLEVRESVSFQELEGVVKLGIRLPAGPRLHVRPEDVLTVNFGKERPWMRVHRCGLWMRSEGVLRRL